MRRRTITVLSEGQLVAIFDRLAPLFTVATGRANPAQRASDLPETARGHLREAEAALW